MPKAFAEQPAQAILPTLWLLWAMVVLVLWFAWYFIHWPIRVLAVHTPLVYQEQKEVEQILHLWQGRNLLDGQLLELKQELESLPWIKSASLQFVWPDKVSIDLQEQRPIAIWNDHWLINDSGHLFQPDLFDQQWPILYGPDDSSAVVMRQYLWFNEIMSPIGYPLAWVELASRGAWTLGFATEEQDIKVRLGMDPNMARLLRVRDWMLVMQAKVPDVAVIDARYENGLAVRSRQQIEQ